MQFAEVVALAVDGFRRRKIFRIHRVMHGYIVVDVAVVGVTGFGEFYRTVEKPREQAAVRKALAGEVEAGMSR